MQTENLIPQSFQRKPDSNGATWKQSSHTLLHWYDMVVAVFADSICAIVVILPCIWANMDRLGGRDLELLVLIKWGILSRLYCKGLATSSSTAYLWIVCCIFAFHPTCCVVFMIPRLKVHPSTVVAFLGGHFPLRCPGSNSLFCISSGGCGRSSTSSYLTRCFHPPFFGGLFHQEILCVWQNCIPPPFFEGLLHQEILCGRHNCRVLFGMFFWWVNIPGNNNWSTFHFLSLCACFGSLVAILNL